MHSGSSRAEHDVHCLDCGMRFETQAQLLNHKRRFCLNSGYDDLDGLAKIEFNGHDLSHQPKIGRKNYLQNVGANSLNKVADYDQLDAALIEKNMKQINAHKRKLEGVQKYERGERLGSSKSTTLQPTVLGTSNLTSFKVNNNYSMRESELQAQMHRFDKPVPKEEAISPPTYIDKMTMNHYSVLDKSVSSMGRMGAKEKVDYAKIKLDELIQIKEQYLKNGGNKQEFRNNIDKMISFYQKLVEDNHAKLKPGYQSEVASTQALIESRCSTPILKLRDMQEKPRRTKQSQVSNFTKKQSRVRSPQPVPAPSTVQPQVIMMPYSPPTAQPSSMPNQGYKLLQRMMELKSEENQKLMEILVENKKNKSVPQVSQLPTSTVNSPSKEDGKGNRARKGRIDEEQEYQFRKSMIEDLISEEKVLMALQQEELDELKLLSQLPKELQDIKMESVLKSAETRHEVEKEMLRLKLQRIAYQAEVQNFEEERKVENDAWAGEERKKLLMHQWNRLEQADPFS